MTKEPSDGFAEVTVEVVGTTDEGAKRRAFEAYRALRADAELPPAEPSYFYLKPPWPGRQPQPLHRVLFERAEDQLERGDWDLSIVLGQTA